MSLTPGQPVAAVLKREDRPRHMTVKQLINSLPALGYRLVPGREGLCLYRVH